MDGRKVRNALRISQVNWAVAQAERQGLPKVLYINIDDSLGEKDKDTRHLEPVDWFHDHSESTKSKPVFKNAFCYLAANLRIGKIVVTVDLRLYLREKPCGGSIVSASPVNASPSAARTVWPAASWQTCALCCRRVG
jgi:hypothetical protein